MSQPQQTFDQWCLVELFGHTKIAGHCTEQNIAGTNMLRVDVPATNYAPAFTRFFGSSAIYSINPIDEQAAKLMAEQLQVQPIQSWDLSRVMEKYQQHQLLLNADTGKQEHGPGPVDSIDEEDDLPY